MDIPKEGAAVPAFVEQLLLTTGPLVSIIEHMSFSRDAGFSSPDAPPVEVFVAALLMEVLEPLAANQGDSRVQSAADVIEDAIELIVTEICLVMPEESDEEVTLN